MRIAVLFGGTSVFAVDTATGRLPSADERKLLETGVATEPPSSLLPQAAKAAGIELPELLERICRGAVKGR